jgi:DNA-directed RNA polymerase specialized sigma24 family protein
VEPDNRKHLEYLYSIHKDRLSDVERAAIAMALYANLRIGQIAKLLKIEAPIVKEMLKRASRKLW